MMKLKNLSKKQKILIASISVVLIVVGAAAGVYSYIRSTYDNNILITETPKDEDKSYTSEEITEPEIPNYGIESDIVNILLVGVDTRGEFEDSRTDSIIIATIDPTAKKVKLTSLMRDMYVEIPGRGYQKINAAFELGGIELLKKTIKYNFGFAIDKYAAIDFKGFQELIDIMGGVELEVKGYEVNEVNKYIKDVNGDNSTLLQGPGMQKLNGQQALSYSRIRKVGNNDYERTERQRRVLSLLLAKVKDTKVTSYPKLYTTIAPYLKTNIEFNSMLKLVYTVYMLNDFTPGSFRIPVDNHFKDTSINGASVLIPDLKYNAKELFKFIYNTVPEKLTVPNNSKVYNSSSDNDKKGSTDQKTTQTSKDTQKQNQQQNNDTSKTPNTSNDQTPTDGEAVTPPALPTPTTPNQDQSGIKQ